MKSITTLLLIIMTSTATFAQNGKARTIKKTFSRTTSIQAEIEASPTVIWELLTNAKKYSDWNSTVISIQGHIAKGEKIKLKSR